MANFSIYYENQIINHMLRGQAFTAPANVYLALYTSNVNLESNNPATEVSGSNYARQEFWLVNATTGDSENNADIEFPEATGNWGEVTAVAILDDDTGDTYGTNVNVLMWGDLTNSKVVDTGDTFKIPAGDLDVDVD